MLLCIGVGRIFTRGVPVDFSKRFSRDWSKVVKFGFHHSKLRKQPVLITFQIPSPIPTQKLVSRKKFVAHHYWCNFNRFNTILNYEILLNLIGKMKYLTDQFQLCFCFCIGNTKQLYLFLHWQHNWHPYSRQFASCCICFVLSLHSGI